MKIEELTAQVIKREKEEWEQLQKISETFGRDDEHTSRCIARWSQWNEFRYMLRQLNNELNG